MDWRDSKAIPIIYTVTRPIADWLPKSTFDKSRRFAAARPAGDQSKRVYVGPACDSVNCQMPKEAQPANVAPSATMPITHLRSLVGRQNGTAANTQAATPHRATSQIRDNQRNRSSRLMRPRPNQWSAPPTPTGGTALRFIAERRQASLVIESQ